MSNGEPELERGKEIINTQKEAQENIRKLNDTFKKLTADLGLLKNENEKRREIVKIPLSVLTGVSSWMFRSAIDDYNEREQINEMEALEKEIDNQPLINIIPRWKKNKEGKLPRKFRKGW